jgi:hypothetical protein
MKQPCHLLLIAFSEKIRRDEQDSEGALVIVIKICQLISDFLLPKLGGRFRLEKEIRRLCCFNLTTKSKSSKEIKSLDICWTVE